MLRLRILSLVLATLSLAAPVQAAVLSTAGGLQGAAVFASSNLDPNVLAGVGLGSVAVAGTALQVKPIPRVIPVKGESDSQVYAMIALGLIGLMLIRRKRYGRN